MYYLTKYKSPIGDLTLASDESSIIGLWISGQKYFEPSLLNNFIQKDNHPILCDAKAWLDDYFAGKKPEIPRLSLAPSGSNFRQEVWKILMKIPYGTLTTYGEISKQMGKMSAQAIGNAIGHNPISIIIPCHRVIGANGNLTGYAGGIDKKFQLLKLEGVDTTKLFMPKV